MLAEVGSGAGTAAMDYLRGDVIGAVGSLFKVGKGLMGGGGQAARQKTIATRTSAADCISWSGCKDSQTSADTQEAGQATGAMSYAFITAMQKFSNLSYLQVCSDRRTRIEHRSCSTRSETSFAASTSRSLSSLLLIRWVR